MNWVSLEFKATDYTISSYETGCRAGGDANTKVPVNRYAGKEEIKNVRKLKLADAQWCVELDGSPRIVGTYKGEPCGPMLHAYAQMKKMYVVMGAHGELSEDGHALITRLTDEIAPEAVHQWRLDGEAGARGETRAIIKYLIRRRIAGATFRAQAPSAQPDGDVLRRGRTGAGRGRTPARVPPQGGRGPGLRHVRRRVHAVRGTWGVESGV